MVREIDPYSLSSPWIFLLRMIIFLILSGLILAFLFAQVAVAFMANPGLNGLILGVGLIGILLTIRQVLRLFPEISWVNGYRMGDPGIEVRSPPLLLAPMASLLSNKGGDRALSPVAMRSILDSIETRLDESREITRYLTGLLVFLGLLGTFWGLLQTIQSVGETVQTLSVGSGDATVIFEDLKDGLSAPLAGMGTAFSSSLFGLTGSLVLGFADLQAGQAQNRFYTELEDWLSSVTDIEPDDSVAGESGQIATLSHTIDTLRRTLADSGAGHSRATGNALANLAEGIQNLVQLARNDKQMVREWAEEQAAQQERLGKLLESLAREFDARKRQP